MNKDEHAGRKMDRRIQASISETSRPFMMSNLVSHEMQTQRRCRHSLPLVLAVTDGPGAGGLPVAA